MSKDSKIKILEDTLKERDRQIRNLNKQVEKAKKDRERSMQEAQLTVMRTQDMMNVAFLEGALSQLKDLLGQRGQITKKMIKEKVSLAKQSIENYKNPDKKIVN